MATTTFSVRMDSDIKERLDEFCDEVGMNTTTAINMFARAVLREKRLPFEVETKLYRAYDKDPFYSEANLKYLSESIAQLERGEGKVYADVSEVLAERGRTDDISG